MPARFVLYRSLMLYVLIVLLIVAVALWLWNTYVPSAPPPMQIVKVVVNIVVVLFALIWLLNVFGYLGGPTPGPRYYDRGDHLHL